MIPRIVVGCFFLLPWVAIRLVLKKQTERGQLS